MSSLSNLAPLPVKKAYTSNQTLDTSVDDFDALLDDMLDSPKVKRPGKTNSQKNKSSKQGLSKKDDFPSSSKTDVKDNVDQTLQKSGPKTSGKDNSKDYMYDSDELSVDNESGLLTSFTANDDLEDSILGGLLKGNKNTVKKASAFGNKVPLTSNIKTNVISSSSAATTKKTETVQSPIDSYSDGGYEFSDDESKDDKKKGSSILAAKKDVGPSSVGVVLAKQKTTSSNIASDEPEPFDISDDEDEEEEESAYRPTVGVKRSVPVVSPHRPSTSLPSSSLSHTAGGSFASSSAVSTAGSRKVFDGSDRAGASGGGTGSLPAETDMFQPKESEEVDIGFVPSFLEPGRQPRQKRNLGGSSVGNSMSGGLGLGGVKGSMSGPLDDLDFALGLRASGGAGTSAALAAGGAGNKVADPFLNAGSISSGTSLGGRVAEKARKESFDSSDSDDDRESNRQSARVPLKTGGPMSFSSPAITTHSAGTSGKGESAAAGTAASAALPSLSRATSFPSPTEKKSAFPQSKYNDDDDDEDELDVSGIVRIQSSELLDSERAEADKNSIPVSRTSGRLGMGSSTGLGSKRITSLTVDINQHSATKSPTAAASASASGQRAFQGSSRGDQTPPSSRKDKSVSFDGSSARSSPSVSASASASSSAFKSSGDILTQDEFQHGGQSSLSLSARGHAGTGAGTNLGLASSLRPTTPPAQSSSAEIQRLQSRLEEAQLQRESSERAMRFEVDSLKARIVTGHELLSSNSSSGSAAHSAELQEMQGEHDRSKNKLLEEVQSLRQKVAQLEGMLARSADEAIVQALKHSEEIKYMRDRREAELSDLDRRKDEELRCMERRHADSVAALKHVHLEELQAVRGRARDGVALDQLAGQIKQTSGSIKILEENLNARYRGLDAAKEGQLEARERLLTEMEGKARERVEAAEIESYRLKGLLVHMEHVAATLRGQGGEETERLRQEHHRLQVMQTSLESERLALQSRAAEDNSAMRQKARDMEAEGRKAQEERRVAEDGILVERQKLEADRADFAAHVSSASRAAEHGASQLKEEEARLKRVREDLSDQKAGFEKKKQMAQMDIQSAEQVRRAVLAAKEDLGRERDQMDRLARDYQVAAERLAMKGEQIDVHEAGLAEREVLLREGIALMQTETMALSRREADVRDSGRLQQQHRASMEDAERALTHKRLEAAAIQKSLSGRQAAASISHLLMPPQPYEHTDRGQRSTQKQLDEYGTTSPKYGIGGSSSGTGERAESDLLTQLRNRASVGVPKGKELSASDRQQRALEEEARTSAKQVLDSVRGQLSRSSGARMEMGRIIEEEAAFLLRRKGATVAAYQQ